MSEDATQIIARCGNKKCRAICNNPVIEFNFFTGEVVYVCKECGMDSKINLNQEAKPLPRGATMGRR